jgi:hypothetical protein
VSDPFADYGKRATTTQPDKLVGAMKTRAEARARYSEIVARLHDCETAKQLNDYLFSIRKETVQYRTELPQYWDGEDDFLGLRKEIDRAMVRVEVGLDWPRYEPEQKEGLGL